MLAAWRRLLGPLWYLALWLVVVWLAYGILMVHRDRWRGVTLGWPPHVPLANVPPWGTTVALEQYEGEALPAALDELQALGMVWLRQPLPWDAIQPEADRWEWATWDRIVEAASARGFRVVLVLYRSPAWARSLEDQAEPLAPPADPRTLAAFARVVAERYGGRVDFYQIWDQPNVRPSWGAEQLVDPAGYLDYLRAAGTAIREQDPDARILTAGLGLNVEAGGYNMSELRFVQALYDAGGADAFDIVALKGFGFWTEAEDRRVSEQALNWSRAVGVREVMLAAGDGETPIWLTEGGWAVLPDDWKGDPPPWGSGPPELQSVRLRAGIERAQREWPWMGAMIVQEFQPPVGPNNPRWGLALRDQQGQRTVLGETLAQAASGWAPGPRWWPWTPGFAFEGTEVALRAPQDGQLTVRLDDAPPQTVQLVAGRLVPIAEGLPLARHTLDVTGGPTPEVVVGVDRSFPQLWAMLGALGVLAVGLGGRMAWLTWQLPWRTYHADLRRLPEPVQLGGFAVAVAAFYWMPNIWLSLALAGLLWLLCAVRLDLGLAAAVFAIPFFLQPKSFLDKQFSLVELLTWLCLAAWLWHLGRAALQGLQARRLDRFHGAMRELWPQDALDWSIVLFVGYAGLSVLWAGIFGVAAREWRVVVFGPAILFWLVRRGLSEAPFGGEPLGAPGRPPSSAWLRLADALLLAGTVVAIYSLYQWLFTGDIITAEGVRRVRGVYASPNNLSLFLGRLVPLALAFALRLFVLRRGQDAGTRLMTGRPLWAALALVPLVASLFLTFSRGAWLLGLPAALLFIAWQQRGPARRLVLLGLLLGGLALIPFAATERISSTVALGGGTWFVRFKLWEATLTMLGDNWNWLKGVGLDNFLYVYQDYRLPEAWREPDLSHPHNLILHPLVALGLLGLLFMVWQQWAFWRATWGAMQRHAAAPLAPLVLGLAASMADTLAHGLIDNSYFLVDLAAVYMVTLALMGLLATTFPDIRPQGKSES